jgi:hypothetical protein
MLQEGVGGSDGHESIVESNGEPRRGYPVNGKEEVKWFSALYIEIKVYAAKLVENKVSDYVRALNL